MAADLLDLIIYQGNQDLQETLPSGNLTAGVQPSRRQEGKPRQKKHNQPGKKYRSIDADTAPAKNHNRIRTDIHSLPSLPV